MSLRKRAREAERWLKTAKEDYDVSMLLYENGRYAHCCFLSQQAAEKAVKALYYWMDREAWGHSILELLIGLEDEIGELSSFKEEAALLDKFYIPTRYPDGLPALTPAQIYTKREAEIALKAAEKILRFSSSFLKIPLF